MFLVHPYDDHHIEMIKDFEDYHSCPGKWTDQLGILRSSVSKEEYDEERKEKNEIDEILCCEKASKILGIWHVQGEKDIRLARVHMIFSSEKVQKVVPIVLDFVFRSWQLEELFMMVHPDDKDMIHYLEVHGYENLGEENGEILYLIEREMLNQPKDNVMI